MIPFLLAALGGYLIGDSIGEDIDKKIPAFAEGGGVAKIDLNKVSNVVVEGIDYDEYPDFSDAYIIQADYDGVPMTEEQIDELNENSEFVHESVFNQMDSLGFADGGVMADGGEIRRFDRHEQMDSETRGEILDTTNQFYLIDGFRNIQNYLYGLFDGYDYSQTDSFIETMKKLKVEHPALHDRIKNIYSKIDNYSFTKMARGGVMMGKGGKAKNIENPAYIINKSKELKIAQLKVGDFIKKKGSAIELKVIEIDKDKLSGRDFVKLYNDVTDTTTAYVDISEFEKV